MTSEPYIPGVRFEADEREALLSVLRHHLSDPRLVELLITPLQRAYGRLLLGDDMTMEEVRRELPAADAAYIAMFALDPEVAELRANLRMTQKAHLMTCQELVNAENEAQIMEEFLTAQGYVRGEDGTWGRTEPDGALNVKIHEELNRRLATPDQSDVDYWLCLLAQDAAWVRAELAALREKYKAITEDAVSGVETVQSVEHYYEEALDRREAELLAANGRCEGAQMVIRRHETELAVLRPFVDAADKWEQGRHPRRGEPWYEIVHLLACSVCGNSAGHFKQWWKRVLIRVGLCVLCVVMWCRRERLPSWWRR